MNGLPLLIKMRILIIQWMPHGMNGRKDRLAGCAIVDSSPAMIRDLNFEAIREESIEAEHQGFVSLEKLRNAQNDTGCVDFLGFECFHNVQELIVDLGAVSKLHLDLV